MTWQHCESGPHAIGGTLHQVLHFREGSSTAVALVRNPSTHADPTLSIWIYHNCAWEEVSSHHDDRPAGTYFPAAFQYEPLEVVVLFGSFTTLLCSFSTCFCFETTFISFIYSKSRGKKDWGAMKFIFGDLHFMV